MPTHLSKPLRLLVAIFFLSTLSAQAWDVGVDYHAISPDFTKTSFLTIYHQPEIRAEVRRQISNMAERGATVISTRIWLVVSPGRPDHGETWRAHFPLSEQEAKNLRQYAQDVAAVSTSRGTSLRLDLCFLWLGSARYSDGTPETGLGSMNLPAEEFTRRVRLSVDRLIDAVKDIRGKDGTLVVHRLYLDGEVNTFGRKNQDWFLIQHYPDFVTRVKAAGFEPSLYFIVVQTAEKAMDNAYRDSHYPALHGRRPMFHVYRTLKFMVDHQLPIPSRIDFSCYFTANEQWSESQVLTRILDDADAALADLGIHAPYGFAETYYYPDPIKRRALGQALAKELEKGDRLQLVTFWTTPNSAEKRDGSGWPFEIEDYLPQTEKMSQ